LRPVLLAAGLTAAAAAPVFAQNSATATVKVAPKPQVISIKQALTQQAEYDGKRVMLVGIFMGQSGSCKGMPPVSSSDVMLQDKTSLCIFVSGPMPEGYDAQKRLGIGKNITLSGFVKKPKAGLPYFEVPSTGKEKKVISPIAYSIEAKKDILEKNVYSIDETVTRQAVLTGKSFSVKGIVAADTAVCNETHANIGENKEYWAITSSVMKQCLWVAGKPPAKVAPNQVAQVYGTLKKIDGKLIFVADDKK